MRMLFDDIDILIVPVTGIAAPTLEKMAALATGHELNTDMLTFTVPFNMSGNPTVTLARRNDKQVFHRLPSVGHFSKKCCLPSLTLFSMQRTGIPTTPPLAGGIAQAEISYIGSASGNTKRQYEEE